MTSKLDKLTIHYEYHEAYSEIKKQLKKRTVDE